MPEDTKADPTDPGTCRPNTKLLKTKGDHFEPMKLVDCDPAIHLLEHVSPDDPIILFTLYYPPEIIEYIVEITNLNPREPRNPQLPLAHIED
jgi:hypothetical protein